MFSSTSLSSGPLSQMLLFTLTFTQRQKILISSESQSSKTYGEVDTSTGQLISSLKKWLKYPLPFINHRNILDVKPKVDTQLLEGCDK